MNEQKKKKIPKLYVKENFPSKYQNSRDSGRKNRFHWHEKVKPSLSELEKNKAIDPSIEKN